MIYTNLLFEGNEPLRHLLNQLNRDIHNLESQLRHELIVGENILISDSDETISKCSNSYHIPPGGGVGGINVGPSDIDHINNNNSNNSNEDGDNFDDFDVPSHETWMDHLKDNHAV